MSDADPPTNDDPSPYEERVIPFPRRPPLPPSGGDGTYGGMELRVARLEEDVRAIRSDLDKIKEKVGHLPTAPMVFWGGLGFTLTLLLGVVATVLGTGSYMSGTMATALSAIQTVLAARTPEPTPPPNVIIVPSHVRPITPPPAVHP